MRVGGILRELRGEEKLCIQGLQAEEIVSLNEEKAAQEGFPGELVLEGGVTFGFAERRGRHPSKWHREKIIVMREARQGSASASLAEGRRGKLHESGDLRLRCSLPTPQDAGTQETPLEEWMLLGSSECEGRGDSSCGGSAARWDLRQ